MAPPVLSNDERLDALEQRADRQTTKFVVIVMIATALLAAVMVWTGHSLETAAGVARQSSLAEANSAMELLEKRRLAAEDRQEQARQKSVNNANTAQEEALKVFTDSQVKSVAEYELSVKANMEEYKTLLSEYKEVLKQQALNVSLQLRRNSNKIDKSDDTVQAQLALQGKRLEDIINDRLQGMAPDGPR